MRCHEPDLRDHCSRNCRNATAHSGVARSGRGPAVDYYFASFQSVMASRMRLSSLWGYYRQQSPLRLPHDLSTSFGSMSFIGRNVRVARCIYSLPCLTGTTSLTTRVATVLTTIYTILIIF